MKKTAFLFDDTPREKKHSKKDGLLSPSPMESTPPVQKIYQRDITVQHLPIPDIIKSRFAKHFNYLYPNQVEAVSSIYQIPIQKTAVESSFPFHADPNDHSRVILNTMQNMLVTTKTSSGKTIIGHFFMIHQLEQKEGDAVAIYFVPLKALGNEKFLEFTALYKDVYDISLIMGGDQRYSPSKSHKHIIITTYEKGDLLFRTQRSDLMENLSCLVFDEFHLMKSNRGVKIEETIARLLGRVSILGLSATIHNATEVANWLNAGLITSSFRPVPLKGGFLTPTQFMIVDRHGQIEKVDDTLIKKFSDPPKAQNTVEGFLLQKYIDGEGVLYFRQTRPNVEAMAKRFCHLLESKVQINASKLKIPNLDGDTHQLLQKCINLGFAFHHAGIGSENKTFIEQAFVDRKIRTIIASPTLCLHPTTKILIAEKNQLKIQFKEIIVSECRAGMLAVSLWKRTASRYPVLVPIAEIKATLSPPMMITFTIENNLTITTTLYHHFLVSRSDKLIIIEANQIIASDLIPIPVEEKNVCYDQMPKLSLNSIAWKRIINIVQHASDCTHVYDIALENSTIYNNIPRHWHVFVANGMYTHNSSGVNVPARWVIIDPNAFRDGKYDVVPLDEILQMQGRAGRPQFDTEGYALIVYSEIIAQNEREELADYFFSGECENIESHFKTKDDLYMSVLGNFAGGYAHTIKELAKIYERTFAFFQSNEFSVHFSTYLKEIIIDMLQCKPSLLTKKDLNYHISHFGTIVNELYIHPRTALYMAKYARNENPKILQPIALAYFLFSRGDLSGFYAKKDDTLALSTAFKEFIDNGDILEDNTSEYEDLNIDAWKSACVLVGNPYYTDIWADENVERIAFYKTHKISVGDIERVTGFNGNFQWIVYAFRRIAIYMKNEKLHTALEMLEIRCQYGVSQKIADICNIKLVGRERAKALANTGYRSIKEIAKARIADIAQIRVKEVMIGEKIATTICEDAQKILRDRKK